MHPSPRYPGLGNFGDQREPITYSNLCLLGTGTGFGSTTNTGGFGSTNTPSGGLFGGGSTGFGSSGGMSTTLFCSGTFC